jgi:hypothetical protein
MWKEQSLFFHLDITCYYKYAIGLHPRIITLFNVKTGQLYFYTIVTNFKILSGPRTKHFLVSYRNRSSRNNSNTGQAGAHDKASGIVFRMSSVRVLAGERLSDSDSSWFY